MSPDACDSIVRGLIRVCEDGATGFQTCAARARSDELRRLFEIRANGCRDAAQTLAALLAARPASAAGGAADADPAADPTADPAADPAAAADAGPHGKGSGERSGWRVPDSAGDDDLAVLDACEEAEDHALSRYEAARQSDLPDEVRGVVRSQHEATLRSHDQVRALRDRARADRRSGRG
jgi:hypothetical protein